MTARSRDMLVAAPARWDEACFAVPAVRALRASGLGVGVLCAENQREFWQTLSGIEVIVFSATEKPKRAAERLRDGWQAALLWEPGFAADAIHAAGIPRRLGPCASKLAKRLTHPLQATPGPLDHRVRFYLTIVAELGVEISRPEFFTPASMGVQAVKASVLLAPDSDFGSNHEWPVARWIEVAGILLDKGCKVTVARLGNGGKAAAALTAALGTRADGFTADPLGSSLRLLAAHELVIAADGSLPHLAAHAGATCVTLFGPNDPAWKRPLGKRHGVAWRHAECAPCLLPKCPLDLRCQHELETATVLALASERLTTGS